MEEIDPESKKFMEWAIPRFYALYNVYVTQAQNDLFWYFQNNKKHVMSKFKEKLMKGAIEHHAPIYDLETVDKEIRQEFLDIIGWSLVREWNEKRLKKTGANQ